MSPIQETFDPESCSSVDAYTRYTVHGRGAKLELLRNTDASMDPFQTWNQSKNMRMELRPSYVSAYARIRKIETTVIWHPFLPVKPHGHFLFFFKKITFFRPKKGSPNRLILFLKARLGGSTFRTPKNRCVKLPVSTSMCPPPISRSQK